MAQAVRSQQELAIAREAQLMYRRAPTFTPVESNLRRWRGVSVAHRHGHGGLLWLRVVPARVLSVALPRAAIGSGTEAYSAYSS